jgi:acyl-CoA synthetase (AMP-forming)/AMP-acid ligase II
VPKEIEFRDELPHTLLGKIDFKTLQEEENERRGLI